MRNELSAAGRNLARALVFENSRTCRSRPCANSSSSPCMRPSCCSSGRRRRRRRSGRRRRRDRQRHGGSRAQGVAREDRVWRPAQTGRRLSGVAGQDDLTGLRKAGNLVAGDHPSRWVRLPTAVAGIPVSPMCRSSTPGRHLLGARSGPVRAALRNAGEAADDRVAGWPRHTDAHPARRATRLRFEKSESSVARSSASGPAPRISADSNSWKRRQRNQASWTTGMSSAERP